MIFGSNFKPHSGNFRNHLFRIETQIQNSKIATSTNIIDELCHEPGDKFENNNTQKKNQNMNYVSLLSNKNCNNNNSDSFFFVDSESDEDYLSHSVYKINSYKTTCPRAQDLRSRQC